LQLCPSTVHSECENSYDDLAGGLKPINIAPLHKVDSDSLLLQITLLDDELAHKLYGGIRKYGTSIELKSRQRLHRYHVDPSVKSTSFDWNELIQKAVAATAWRIELLSPTTCKEL
jgi:hypothetical protein